MQQPAANDNEQGDTKYSLKRIVDNDRIVMKGKTFVSVVGGCVAGLWGLTKFEGVAWFFLCYFLVSLWYYIQTERLSFPCFRSKSHVWTASIVQCILSFVLFWTLAYDIVYMF